MPIKRKEPVTIPAIPWQDCVAKSLEDGSPGVSVLDHCRHVASVARVISWLLPRGVVSRLGGSPVVAAAVHDIGKVSPGFQKKYFPDHVKTFNTDLAAHSLANYETKHASISEASINVFLDAQHESAPFAAVAGAHHGKRDGSCIMTDQGTAMGGPDWARERRALLNRLIEEYGNLEAEPEPDLDILSGLVCVADWIGSGETHFPPSGLPDDIDLVAHARQAVADCGLELVPFRPGLGFEEVFGFPPYPVQRDLIEAVEGPGLYVLEAPMGQGKTEAALYAAYKLMEAGHHHGLYFGLPTRLTSDRIHERVEEFIRKIAEGDPGTRLAHGQAWLEAFKHGGRELDAGKSWFRPNKRALLMPFAVGTIDQALLSVMKVRHHFIRTFGLAGKVVILDEVHSYDVYTGRLLNLLVRRLLDIGCTVIVLSATLTRARRGAFSARFSSSVDLDKIEAYPLISAETREGFASISSEAPATKRVDVSMESISNPEVAELVARKATSRHSVLCIANTVAQAQRWYSEVKAVMAEGSFDIGLLHSAFPAWRRAKLEAQWMTRLGKGGDRSRGCVLVATQVVEQSVDIDADLMITELAPTDMLLQRLGRLWRHEHRDRPCKRPSVLIVVGDLSSISSYEDLEEALGKTNCRVYQPYVLWKSHKVWSHRDEVDLPDDIRGLLESTYLDPADDEPFFLDQAKKSLEQQRLKLQRLAETARADVKGFCTMRDDERAATRYSSLPTIDALLVRSVEPEKNKTTLALSDGQTVKVSAFAKNPWVTAQLHLNLVSVPVYRLSGAKTPSYLKKHFYDTTAVLVIESDGELTIDGASTGLRYDDERGLQRDLTCSAKSSAGYGFTPLTTIDEDDWEGGLDEFGW